MRGGRVSIELQRLRKLRQRAFKVESVRIGNAKIQMGTGRLGVKFNDLLEVADCLFGLLRARKYHSKRSQRLRIIWTDFQRIANDWLCFTETRFPSEYQP